jgi:Ca-activated chloride channel family protein
MTTQKRFVLGIIAPLILLAQPLLAANGPTVSIQVTAPVQNSATHQESHKVHMEAAMGSPLALADRAQTAYLKVGLVGFSRLAAGQRPPVNLALVLDRSGSMDGEKINHARKAAIMAVEQLIPTDRVAVVSFSDDVTVMLPSTRADDLGQVRDAIERIQAGGSTALYAGVSKGAAEVRNYMNRNQVNRVILLSDGLANVGPSSTGALGDLGDTLARDGIPVTTIGLGLGYNEDLMTTLARNSAGNHAFAENAVDLERIFQAEFGDALAVVAQDVTVRIQCADGVRPLRVMGRKAQITGQTVVADVQPLYSEQERYLVLEVELPARPAGSRMPVAEVNAAYDNLATHARDVQTVQVEIGFTPSEQEVERKADAKIMVPIVEQIANERSKEALTLRDQGKVEEARRALQSNAAFLGENARRYKSKRLDELKSKQGESAQALDKESWGRQRKLMRKDQYKSETQQTY